MFWRRKSEVPKNSVFTVNEHAAKLGIERRLHVRVRYPLRALTTLPQASYQGRTLFVFDISAGGLCLLDPEDHLGPDAGQKVELTLRWPKIERRVSCRLVSRVHDRRHIQFLDLESERAESIKRAIDDGVRGLAMKPVIVPVATRTPALAARELWNSVHGDSLSFFDDIHLLADATVNGKSFRIHKESWPAGAEGKAATVEDVEGLLLFLANLPNPSPAVKNLLSQLCLRHKEKCG